jgi:sphinganine-1-phosphate aldolase
MFAHLVTESVDAFNERFKETEPIRLVIGTTGALLSSYLLFKVVQGAREHPHGIKGYLFHNLLSLAEKMPMVNTRIAEQKSKMYEKVKQALPKIQSDEKIYKLPLEGIAADELLNRLQKIKDQDHVSTKLSGTIYMPMDEHSKLLASTFALFMHTNPLHYDVFLSTKKFEAEVVSMTVQLLNGKQDPVTGDGACGAMTSGGTESILMALKAYRDQARAEKPWIKHPEIVAPTTAHAAFDKGCHYFGIKLVHVDVDQTTFKVDPMAVRKKITRNTIAIVASAPSFPQGSIDPIEDLAKIALEYNIGFHVDCCLGGFVLPFAKKLGYDIPDFDYRVNGVKSISADTHKYGLATKGSSVITFHSKHLRRYMYFVCPSWTGGIYASPSIAGSRAGAQIATCWASMMHMGEKGYLESTKRIMEAARKIKQGIEQIPNLYICGEAKAMVVAFASKTLNIYQIGDRMSHRGWTLNTLQYPASLHICVTPNNAGSADEFLQDLRTSVEEVQNKTCDLNEGMAPLYGLAVSLPDKALIQDLVGEVLDTTLEV